MSNVSALPSTIDGIKRLAKAIKHQERVAYHVALDLAANRAGYQNIRHAQAQLPASGVVVQRIFLTAYWHTGSASGRETLEVRPGSLLTALTTARQLGDARHLKAFRQEAPDHLERRVDVDTQLAARNDLIAAARTLHFMAITGLRPGSAKLDDLVLPLQRVPGHDHASVWMHEDSDTWVYMDEPYPKHANRGRREWAESKGIGMAVPSWHGLYAPGKTEPYFFSLDQALVTRIAYALESAPEPHYLQTWTGESADYATRFVSPARVLEGTMPRRRPMPSGAPRKGAVPYGALLGGQTSKWRPAKPMALDTHVAAGRLLSALDSMAMPYRERDIIRDVRNTLDNWMHMEYPEGGHHWAAFYDAYWGSSVDLITGNAAQTAGVAEVIRLVAAGYDDCRPRRAILALLGRVGSRLTATGSPATSLLVAEGPVA
jgi:hypothetical protein